METPHDSRKTLDCPDRIWNWSTDKWLGHAVTVNKLTGIIPKPPEKPNPDDEAMVMLNTGNGTEVKYVRDMLPNDHQRVNAWLPSRNEWKKIYQPNSEA
jgi:hypothetical protein